MGTTRFQLGLITVLAFALGIAVSSKPAGGHPAGPVISSGVNPLWTVGGSTSSSAVISAPSDQDMVITDLFLSPSDGNRGVATLTSSGGTILGQFYLQSYNSINRTVQHPFTSGIRIPRGESVSLTSGITTYYSMSGYYAQP